MSVTFTNGNPVGFVILERDGAELHLTLVKGHRAGHHNVAHLIVTDATTLYEHLVTNGVRIVKGLRDAHYGLRGFVRPTRRQPHRRRSATPSGHGDN